MSKVYIEGFKMPKSCKECLLKVFILHAQGFFCTAYTGANYIKGLNKRAKFCPLRESDK